MGTSEEFDVSLVNREKCINTVVNENTENNHSDSEEEGVSDLTSIPPNTISAKDVLWLYDLAVKFRNYFQEGTRFNSQPSQKDGLNLRDQV